LDVAVDGRKGLNAVDRSELAALVRELAVVLGRVTLSSGKEADYYVDLRRATLHHRAAPLIGRLMRELTADWDYAAAGGLTMGADPVAYAVALASRGAPPVIDAFSVRKEAKGHGTKRRVEGNFRAGDRVVVVEDVITSGGSAIQAIAAVEEAGGTVLGVLAVVDREQGGVAALTERGHGVVVLTTATELGLR